MKGGVALSQGNPSCLRFSLEESVWFQRGQEVLDLISISLDPDILIQENDQYVTIQGALELSGEYKRNEIETMEAEDTFAAPKFIQVVDEREEGICEFNHFFPVDITIPKNRIENIRDIDVTVESFDYVFPERSCLKLTANLMIAGLYGEQQRTTSSEINKEEELESLYRSSAAVAEVDVHLFAQPSINETEVENDDRLELAVEEERMELAVESKEMQSEETTELKSVEEEKVEIHVPFHAEARKQLETEVTEEVKVEEQVEVKPEITFMAKRIEESHFFNDIQDRTASEESPSQVLKMVEEKIVQEESSDDVVLKKPSKQEKKASEKDGKQKKKKKSMSLTEFFSRKEEEEEVAKLKVCIVQNGDTVDMIAERYDIPVQQLLRVNHLEINQDIHEGQVLYIPVAVAR